MGFVVPKYGHSAVQRNQLKRRLRELIRLVILGALRTKDVSARLDIVIRARPSAYDSSLQTLRAECEVLKGRLVRLRSGLENSASAVRTESRPTP